MNYTNSGRWLGDSPFGEPACISPVDANWPWDLGTPDLGSSPQRPGNTLCSSISQELLWSWWLAVKSTSTAQLFFLPSHQLEVCGGKFVALAPEFDSGATSELALLVLPVLLVGLALPQPVGDKQSRTSHSWPRLLSSRVIMLCWSGFTLFVIEDDITKSELQEIITRPKVQTFTFWKK